jgi:hypothetical protein
VDGRGDHVKPGSGLGGQQRDGHHTLEHQQSKRKKRKAKKRKAGLNLGYFSLWWSRMEREGARHAETVRSAKSMRTFLHAGSRDIQNIQNEEAIYGWNHARRGTLDCLEVIKERNLNKPTENTTSKGLERDIVTMGRGMKRLNIGGTESPSKKQRKSFKNLLEFWGGTVATSINDHKHQAVSKENYLKNATTLAREYFIGVTKTKLDNPDVDLGLTTESDSDLTCGGDGGTGF